MIVKFETGKGCKMFDGFQNVEWTYDVMCLDKNVNVVDVPYDVMKTTNFQYINDTQSPDEMAEVLMNQRVVGGCGTPDGCASKVSVDEVFTSDDVDSDRKVLFYCFGRDNKLKLFYSERPVYILNDNGKTVERV